MTGPTPTDDDRVNPSENQEISPERDPLLRRLARFWPPNRWDSLTVLVAVSGGADSMALADALGAIRPSNAVGRLVWVHFNHGLRGAESDEDEALVVTWAKRRNTSVFTGRPKPRSTQTTGSEDSWRRERYAYFQQVAAEVGARYLVTAHTADDQVETVIQRIVRGTGIAGLAGIPFARRVSESLTVVRPLLGIRRQEITEYLARVGVPFRVDSSNESRAFQRNRVRHEVLPALERALGRDPRVALLRLARSAREAFEAIEQRASATFDKAIQLDPGHGTATIDADILAASPRAEQREVLVMLWRAMGWPLADMGRNQWGQVLAAVARRAPLDKMLPGGITMGALDGKLCLTRSR